MAAERVDFIKEEELVRNVMASTGAQDYKGAPDGVQGQSS